nr:hypothetical protein [Tanacetum cinerariifolium]
MSGSNRKKVANTLSFYRMETDEISEQCIAPSFVNGLEAYDSEVNLEFDENLISNEFAIKLCLDYEFGEELPSFVWKMKKSNRNKKRAMENLNLFYQDIRPSSSAGGLLTQEEAEKEALAIKISQKFALLEEERPAEALGKLSDVLCQVGVTTIIAKFLILDIPIDRGALIVVGRGFLHTMESDNDDEEEYMIKRNKFGAPIYGPKPVPYLNCTNPEDRSSAIQTVTNPFRKNSVWKKAVSILGSLPVPLKQVNWKPDYKGSYTKEKEATRQWRTEIRLTDPYGNIYLQGFTTKKTDQKLSKYHKLSDIMSPNWFMEYSTRSTWNKGTPGTHDGEAGSSRSKRLRQHEIVEEVFLPQVHHEFLLWEGCSRDTKSRAFNINEPIYVELCHKFYSIYEFDEVYVDDELQSKNIIKFRLGGRAHSLTLLEFAQRLGLYQAVELEEDGFNVYFEGGLRNDDNFNAKDYWLSISREDNLGLSRSHTSTIRNLILRVFHKITTYGLCQKTTGYDKVQKNDLWLLSMFDARHQNRYANIDWVITRWMKRKGAETQKESQICCGQFISKLARKYRVLTEDVVRSLSASVYCRDLDSTSLRDLIDSEGKLIPEDPQPGVPRVGIHMPPRASMQDLYDKMGRMEIR